MRFKSTHGMHGTSTWMSWMSMIQRCTNPNAADYPHYGGRGITVCDRWRQFANFFDDMGERPAGKTLDRIDNNVGYSSDNCRWATPLEQRHNQRPHPLQRRNISGIAGVRKVSTGKWEVKVPKLGRIATTSDFFEACCIRMSALNHLNTLAADPADIA